MAKPIVKQTKAVQAEQREIINLLTMVKDRMMRTGMLMSSHGMDELLLVAGFEVAALQCGTWPESAWKGLAESPSWRTNRELPT